MEELVLSFIRIEHLYGALSRKLLRGAPNSSAAKWTLNSQMIKEYRREGPVKETKLQRKAIPGRGAHHWESTILPSRDKGVRDKEFSWMEGSSAPLTKNRATKLAKIGRSNT